MLVYIREQLLERDYSMCLKRLFKYPPVEDVHSFVVTAIKLRDDPAGVQFGGDNKPKKSVNVGDMTSDDVHMNYTDPSPSSSSSSSPSSSSGGSLLSSGKKKKKKKSKAKSMLTNDPKVGYSSVRNRHGNTSSQQSSAKTVTNPLDDIVSGIDKLASQFNLTGGKRNSSSSSGSRSNNSQYAASGVDNSSAAAAHNQFAISECHKELAASKQLMMRQGNRLNGAISTLQTELQQKAEGDIDQGLVVFVLAELKQIRDILTFQIEDDGWDGENEEYVVTEEVVVEEVLEEGEGEVVEVVEEKKEGFDPLGVKKIEE
eukprot:TRINITY_DN756_c0_g1_i1.p1 TRINITY_DN756_c0_g1~~TRINITY_DN756_c0_g1_i1.p1  ORF type:complete len:315 (-),score=134.93 TRINITY_DN756_c0_g1_i1:70-1014(-)